MSVCNLSKTKKIQFDELVKQNYKKIYNFAFELTKYRQDAEDLTQDSLVRAYQSFNSFQGDKPFANWMFRIVFRLYLDHKRFLKRREGIKTIDFEVAGIRSYDPDMDSITYDPKDSRKNPEELILEGVISESILNSFKKLTPLQKEIIELVVGQELSYNEIAIAEGTTYGSINSRFNTSKNMFKKKYLKELELAS